MLHNHNNRLLRMMLTALLAVSLFASEAALTMLWSDPAFAKGNGGGNGSGGGGGGNGGGGGGGGNGGGGNGGGNAGGGGNGGGNGGDNAGGNAGGNGKGKGHNSPGAGGAGSPETGVEANSALGLREAGIIRSLPEVFKVAEEQLHGRVLDAELVGSTQEGWNYDLRVVTEDGQVRRARYDAATLALEALDGQPIE